MPWIVPDWPAPKNVKAISTTREGGVSLAPFESFNLGGHVGDNLDHVHRNRQQITAFTESEPYWLNQIHSPRVVDLASLNTNEVVDADASYTNLENQVSIVMTADCLPVLLCSQDGSEVAAVHAGWRGLVDGIVENSVRKFRHPASHLMAWLGPAIGPEKFEIGGEVRDAFVAIQPEAIDAFVPAPNGKWLANIYHLATLRLHSVGVTAVYGGDRCTVTEKETFFSYRRDGQTGRQASLIWLTTD